MTEMLMADVGRDAADGFFRFCVRPDERSVVVAMSGALDLASRAVAAVACLSAGSGEVIVDLADLTFMDCAGYSALVASRNVLVRRGGSLSLVNARGEPLRLLTLIGRLERDATTVL